MYLRFSFDFAPVVAVVVSHATLIGGIVLDECVDNVALNFVNRCPLVAALQALLMLRQHQQLLQLPLQMHLRFYLYLMFRIVRVCMAIIYILSIIVGQRGVFVIGFIQQ